MASISKARKVTYYIGIGMMFLGFILFISLLFTIASSINEPNSFVLYSRPSFINAVLGMVFTMGGAIVANVGARGVAGLGFVLDPNKAWENLKLFREYFISLGCSLFGSLGLICFLNVIFMVAFSDEHRYPYLLPFSVIVGGLCFVLCVCLFVFNINYLKSVKRIWIYIIKEVLIVIISFIPCFVVWNVAIEYIGQLF